MTQAFNLALLGNNVNTSGQINADTAIYNTVNVANGGTNLSTIAARSIPVANTLDTYTTVTPAAGQSVRINAGNTAWESFTPGTGTVTSVATGNGLSGGTITSSGTLVIAAPGFNTVGSYVQGVTVLFAAFASGSSIAAGSANGQLSSGSPSMGTRVNNLSGTWRSMSGSFPGCSCGVIFFGVFVRVA